MNIKRIIFWLAFIIILALIIWGLVVAMNKPVDTSPKLGTPMALNSTDHVRGPENAKVTLIEYSDFQCPACGAYHPVVERLLSEAPTSIKFIYRNFPLSQHVHAQLAAENAEAASRQGKFWDMYNKLFDTQTEWENSTDTQKIFDGYAQGLGINVSVLHQDLLDPTIKAKIAADQDDGTKIGISGTPTFFVNGKGINNPNSYEEFKAIIAKSASSTAK